MMHAFLAIGLDLFDYILSIGSRLELIAGML